MYRQCFPEPVSICPAASPCTRLSRARSTTSESDFHGSFWSPQDGPFDGHTRRNSQLPKTAVDLSGSLTLPFLRVPCSQTPPQSPAPIAHVGGLLLPSRFSTLSACGFSTHEAQSLHLRYGLRIALSTLNPCRYLHEPKTRFPVGRLFPLAGAGISPAGSVRLRLTHRRILPSQDPPRCGSRPSRMPAPDELPDVHCGPVESQSSNPRTSDRRSA